MARTQGRSPKALVKALVFEINKLEMKKGDVLAVKFPGTLPPQDQQRRIQDVLSSILPPGTRNVIFFGDVDLFIITPPVDDAAAQKAG